MTPGEQRLFEVLAVFADAEVTAIETVVDELGAIEGEAIDVLDGLAGLVEKSLLRRVDAPGAEPRVAMLQTIHEFAADRLDQRPDLASRARHAHATHYTDVARRLRAALTGAGREVALETLAADVGNLRRAWDCWVADGNLAQLDALAKTLLILDDAHGWYLDTARLATEMLAVLDTAPSTAEGRAWEIGLRTTHARALMATHGVTPEVEAAFSSVLDRFEGSADVRQQYPVLRGLASLYLFQARLDQAARIGREILALGEAADDDAMRIDGHLLVGTDLMTFDDLPGGLEHVERAIALIPARPGAVVSARVGNDPRVACFTTSALILLMLGRPDRAAERADGALALAAALDHPFTTAYARFHAGLLRLWRREPDQALELARGLVDLADEHEFPIWTATGNVLLGAALVELGEVDAGIAAVEAGIGRYGELRSPPIFWPFLRFVQAGAYAGAGRWADGLRVTEESIGMLESGGSRASFLPEVWMLKGDLLLALASDPATGARDAEPWYRRAIDRSAELGGGKGLLRATTRLARLRVAGGDPQAAAALVEPVLAGFTEGLDTPDVRDARALARD